MVMTRMALPIMNAKTERLFWAKVDKKGPDECWEWTGARTPPGNYGKICVKRDGKQNTYIAHRIAFYIATGEWPRVVMHTCDNPSCVNARHLRAGTPLENNHDMIAKGRHSHGDRHWTRKNPKNFDPYALSRYGAAARKRNPDIVPHGENHFCAKLTEKAVRDIRRRYKKGVITHKQLAAEYGVSASLIWHVLAGKIWRRVD